MPATREITNVLILASSQALYLITAVTMMTLSGVVGQLLAPSPALATLPIAAMMVGAVLTSLPASLLMNRYGRRRGFLIGTAGGGIGGGALAVAGVLSGSFWLFCAGNLILGTYQGFAMYYRFAAADAVSERFRSQAISLVLAGGVVAAFLGPWNASLGQRLIPAAPEAGPYAIIVGLTILATLLIGMLDIPPRSTRDATGQRSFATIAKQPTFIVAVLASAVAYTIMILVMTATPLAMLAHGFDMSHVALVMQWHVLGMFAPSFFTGRLIERFGLLAILLTGMTLLFATVAVATAGQTLAHFLAALLLLGVGWNFAFISASTLLTTTHAAAETGKVQGANDLIVSSLVAIGSLMAGTLLHTIGWTGLNLAMLPFITLIGLAVMYLLFATARRNPKGTPPLGGPRLASRKKP